MYEYIKGSLTDAAPTYAVVECGGIGYYVNISVNTYSQIAGAKEVVLFLHLIVREDAHLLYGFASKEERALFRQLISVSGVGANTAGVMLSSMTVNEIAGAIMTENVNAIKSVKGIGLKTAQRVIIELKDKVGGMEGGGAAPAGGASTVKDEALAALVMLGFQKSASEKVLKAVVKESPSISVEEAVRQALRRL